MLAAMAARALPSLGHEEAIWGMPFCMLGFYVMQAQRLAGVKGIGRKDKSRKIWEAWQRVRPDKER